MGVRPLIPSIALLVLATGSGSPSASGRPDVALSASYLPPRYLVPDPEKRERVHAYLQSQFADKGRGASEEFAFKGASLRLSRKLAAHLAEAAGSLEKGRGVRERARMRLEKLLGSGVEIDEPVFVHEYLPQNIGFTHQDIPQWPLKNDGTLASGTAGVDINIAPVWEQFDGDDTLVIAVIDAGFNFHHPALQNRWYENPGETGSTQSGDACWTGAPADRRFNACDDDGNGFVDDWRGWNFVENDNNTQDYHGHGTLLSGVLAATFDTGTGMTGMLPRVRILPVRVISTAGFGHTGDIIEGVRYAARMDAHVINFSIGISGGLNTSLRDAFAEARDSGVIVAAAAGNSTLDLQNSPPQPGSYGFGNVYMIAAHNARGELSGFSNYGAGAVEIAAPGEQIVTAGIPAAITLTRETFENPGLPGWTLSPSGGFAALPDSIEGAASLQWASGHNAAATLSGIDLRGHSGGALTLRVHFAQGNASDRLRVSVIPEEGPERELGRITETDSVRTIVFNLGEMDGTRFDLRFRACVGQDQSCSTFGSISSRVVRLDDIRIRHADEESANQEHYRVTQGTSLAAPYFAGYAGLMRLAADRAEVPLTRERMLAGSVPVPALEEKVVTGGRLDVAKGLDFYLRTLPRIVDSEPADSAWDAGERVHYAFGVADSGGPREGFAFSPVTSPEGSSLSSTGAFQWNSPETPGMHVLRVKAETPSLTLRKMLPFALVSTVPVIAAAPERPSLLRIGGRDFLLPPAVFAHERHVVRVEIYGADGRVQDRVTGQLRIPPGERNAVYRLPGFHGVGARAWLNGTPLKAAP